jgi:hypothetical protein
MNNSVLFIPFGYKCSEEFTFAHPIDSPMPDENMNNDQSSDELLIIQSKSKQFQH